MLVITLAIAIEFEQAGILLSLFATYVRVLVTIFHCYPILRAAHLSVVCLLFTSVILLHFGRGGKRDTSAAPILPFVGIAVYAVAPLAHWATVSESTSVSSTTFAWLLLPYLQVTLQVPTIWFMYIMCKGWAWSGCLPAWPARETPPPWHCRPLGLLSPTLAWAHLFR